MPGTSSCAKAALLDNAQHTNRPNQIFEIISIYSSRICLWAEAANTIATQASFSILNNLSAIERTCLEPSNPAHQLQPDDGFDHGVAGFAVVQCRHVGKPLASVLFENFAVFNLELLQCLKAIRRKAGRHQG